MGNQNAYKQGARSGSTMRAAEWLRAMARVEREV